MNLSVCVNEDAPIQTNDQKGTDELETSYSISSCSEPLAFFDGKYIFFTIDGNINWVDAGIINDAKNN